MLKFFVGIMLALTLFNSTRANAQIFNYVKVLYLYTYNNVSGEQKLFAINISKDVVEGKNLHFFTHLKNTSEEFDLTVYELDIMDCKGDDCTIRANIFSPKLGNTTRTLAYSRKNHKKFSIIFEDSSGNIFTIMSATGWKEYAERRKIELPMWDQAVDPAECGTLDYCYKVYHL